MAKKASLSLPPSCSLGEFGILRVLYDCNGGSEALADYRLND